MSAEGVSTATLRTINDASFEAEVAHANEPTLVCFFAPNDHVREAWLVELESQFSGRIRVISAPLADSPNSAMRQGVVLTPAYVMFENGRKRAFAVGALNPEDLTQFVNRALK